MLILLCPQRTAADTLTLARDGTALIINGVSYDFGPLPEGATLPRDAVDCPQLASDVTRIDGQLHLTLLFPIEPRAGAAARFPEPILVGTDGPIALPDPTTVQEAAE